MTTDAMNCEHFNEQLMDYLEHDVDAATRASVEHHAATCDDCGALLADIRKLRVDAANMPELVPSRDLWSGIAARIETPVVPIGAGGTSDAAAEGRASSIVDRRTRRRWLNSALIAASLVGAAMIGYGARGVERDIAQNPTPTVIADPPIVPDGPSEAQVAQGPERPAGVSGALEARGTPESRIVPPPAVTTPAAGTSRVVEVQVAVAKLTQDYDREIARLRLLIDQRRSQLDPTTVSVIERNLAVIDTAIAESRRAIASDPSSRFLIEFLNQSLQDKVELMRTAALLPSRTT